MPSATPQPPAPGLHLVFDAARDDTSAASPSSYSDASFSSASSSAPATPRSRESSPALALAQADDEDCWNLIPYHVPWGNEYYDYTPGMLPGPDGQCFFYRSPTPLKFKRTMRACSKCRDRKAKCSGEKPACARCVNRGYLCHYDSEEPKRPKGPELARQRLRDKGARSPAPPRASPALAAPSPRVVPKCEEVDMLADLSVLEYPAPEAEAWGAPQAQSMPEPSPALEGAIDPQRLVHTKPSPQSPPLLLYHEPELVVPSHNVPCDYWSYSAAPHVHQHHHHHPSAGMVHYPASVHAPQPVKQVPPFLSAPRSDEPPPAAPPPIVIPQPPILQAALMAVPESAHAPAPEPVWHDTQAFGAYSTQELIDGYTAYDYAPAANVYAHEYAALEEYTAHQAYYDVQMMYGQEVGVAPAATYLASAPVAPYVSYAV